MPVWSVSPVEEVPELELISWQIFEAKMASEPHPTRHLVGYSLYLGEGRVTSAIIEFDPSRARLRTRSGRIYYLDGRPGENPDAAYVWRAWKQINEVTEQADVTEEVYAAIQAAAPQRAAKSRRKRPVT